MDWTRVKESNKNQVAAALERIETCWRMKGPSGRVFECCIYRTAARGVERCGYGEDGLLRSQLARDVSSARDISEQWRQAVFAKGGFTNVVGAGKGVKPPP